MTARCVLVIDGGLVVKETIDRLHERLDAEVLVEHQGQVGIQRALELLPDLILLDSNVTNTNGGQVYEQILELQALKDTPMVIIASRKAMNRLPAIQKSSSVALVQHPISPKELAGICERVILKPPEPPSLREHRDQTQTGTSKASPFPSSPTSGSRKVKFAMRGYLNMVSTGEVLQLLKHKAHSGLLRITSGRNRLDVFINKGDIAFARSHAKDDEFLLGRFLVEAEALQPEDLDRVLTDCVDNHYLIGERLVQLGHITRKQLNDSIRSQTEALVYESLRWQEGEFLFFVTNQMPREVREIGLRLSVDRVLMEGFQRVHEWSMIENEIQDMNTILTPAPEPQNIKTQIESLEPKERKILALVDGYRSVQEIIRLSWRSSFDVCSTLFRLLSYKIIVKRSPLEFPS